MKSATLLVKVYELGTSPSCGRQRLSNNNPYTESLLRTLKYCPQWPSDGYASLEDALHWVHGFMSWYNREHQYSRIRFMTQAERYREPT